MARKKTIDSRGTPPAEAQPGPDPVAPQDGTAPAAKAEDPSPSCATCKHHHRAGEGDADGECRRYPPAVVIPALTLTPKGPLGIFPITLLATTCGEHQV